MTFRSPLASAPGVGQTESSVDFVTSDMTALAAHMKRCASARGRLFAVRGSLQTIHSLAAGRIVTLACLAVVVGAAVLSVS